MNFKLPTTLGIIFCIVLGIAVFFRWYTHNHQQVDTVTTHCPSPTDADWATAKLFESDRCYELRKWEEAHTPIIFSPDSPESGCCVYCEQGQACGNSCISQNDQCHQLEGCACNRVIE